MKFSDLKVEFQNCRNFPCSPCDPHTVHYSAVREPPLNTRNPTVLILILMDLECIKAGNISPRALEVCKERSSVLPHTAVSRARPIPAASL